MKSYGELVTAIIQPQHVVSPEYTAKLSEDQRKGTVSPMPNYNGRMTVAQLTDIVTFLSLELSEGSSPGRELSLLCSVIPASSRVPVQ